ncbi:MAG: hypothetical protein NTZ97_01240 [Candidatus Moranbacteria bacterium]|nr:hypothetical protein [Candidatus Moranbacteria bacterium]
MIIIISCVITLAIIVFFWWLNRNAVFARFQAFEYLVYKFAFHNSVKEAYLTGKWAEKIAARLDNNCFYVNTLIKNMSHDPAQYDNLKDAFVSAIRRLDIKSLDSTYRLCNERGFAISALLIRPVANKDMQKKFPAYFNGDFDFSIIFFEEIVKPVAMEMLNKFSSISKLEEIRKQIVESLHPLVDEREIEILKETDIDLKEMLELLSQLKVGTVPHGYYLEFIVGVAEMYIAEWRKETLLTCLNDYYKTGPDMSCEGVKFILEKVVPTLDKKGIDNWMLKFAANQEFLEIFAKRIRELYAEAEIEELAAKWNLHKGTPSPYLSAVKKIEDIFDELMKDWLVVMPLDKFEVALDVIPLDSSAWKNLAAIICSSIIDGMVELKIVDKSA